MMTKKVNAMIERDVIKEKESIYHETAQQLWFKNSDIVVKFETNLYTKASLQERKNMFRCKKLAKTKFHWINLVKLNFNQYIFTLKYNTLKLNLKMSLNFIFRTIRCSHVSFCGFKDHNMHKQHVRLFSL